MDQQQLRELLKARIDANATASAGPVRGEDAIHSAMRALLDSEPELQGGAKLLLVGNCSFNAVWILPQVVLNRARTKGPDDAIRWLSKVLSATKVSVLRVMPLWGLEVSQPTDLTQSIRLLPWSELPNLSQWPEAPGPRLGFDVPFYQFQPPKTALVARIERELISDKDEYDVSTDSLLARFAGPCAWA